MSDSYLHWGVIQISVTNAVVIVAMVVVFGLVGAGTAGTERTSHDRYPGCFRCTA